MSEEQAEEGASAAESVAGERSVASVNAARSLQSRVSNMLAMGLMATLGLGLLGWYYAHTFARQGEVKRAAQTASRVRLNILSSTDAAEISEFELFSIGDR